MFSWYMSPFLCQEPLHGRNFTFWEWFYSILKLTKDWLHGPWKERSDILHFLQKQIQLCNTNHSDFCSKVEFILLSEIYCQGFFAIYWHYDVYLLVDIDLSITIGVFAVFWCLRGLIRLSRFLCSSIFAFL